MKNVNYQNPIKINNVSLNKTMDNRDEIQSIYRTYLKYLNENNEEMSKEYFYLYINKTVFSHEVMGIIICNN